MVLLYPQLPKLAAVAAITILGLSACVPEDGQLVSTNPTNQATTQMATTISGEWGRNGCAKWKRYDGRNAADRKDCNKGNWVFNDDGTLTRFEYSSDNGSVSNTTQYIKVRETRSGSQWDPADGQGVFLYSSLIISASSENGVPVLDIELKSANGGKSVWQRALRVSDLNKGYSLENRDSSKRLFSKGYYSVITPEQNGRAVDSSEALSARVAARTKEIQESRAASGDIPTSGLCGLPRDQVSDAERRKLHTEASKSQNFSFPFQTVNQVVAEYNRTGAQGCQAIGQQFKSSMSAFRSAMSTANRLNNGTSRGVQCRANSDSASDASYCAATALLYQVKTVSALCHAVCK
ncbi:MAG: hypothetical protein AAF826_08065 [Pseudomonadota bacterium]